VGWDFPRFPEYEIHYYQFLAAAQQVFELFAEVLAAMRQRGLWLKKNPDRRPHQPLWLRQLRQPRGRLFWQRLPGCGPTDQNSIKKDTMNVILIF